MTIHEMDDKEFLEYVARKPFDAVTSVEFMRVFALANRAVKPERWLGCGECDTDFDCYNGENRCIRLAPAV